MGGAMTSLVSVPGSGPVRAYGEMVDLLWKDGNAVAALQLEELWNDPGRAPPGPLIMKKPIDVGRLLAAVRRHCPVAGP